MSFSMTPATAAGRDRRRPRYAFRPPTLPHCYLDRKLGNQQYGRMKTTLDLPDALMKQVKLRALREGRKLKDAVADLLRRGLAAQEAPAAGAPVIGTDPQTGLPLVECKRSAAPRDEMTPERVADVLLAQEVEWRRDAGR